MEHQSQNKFVILFGLVALLLGSFAFASHSMLGIMVDMLQGVLYVASGLFAFAAVMRGPTSVRRFTLVFALIYAIVFFAGIAGQGFVVYLFRVNIAESIIHLVFAAGLLFLNLGEQALVRWLAPAKPIT